MILNARRLRAMTWFLLSVGTILIASDVHAQTGNDRYINEVFGFSVEIPKDRSICKEGPDSISDHGILIFLDQGPSDCRNHNKRPFVSVNGEFNATDDQSPFETVARHCKTQKTEKTAYEVFGDLKNQWPAMCRSQGNDGFADIQLARQTPQVRADIPPVVNYSVFIHARPEALSTALKEANAILWSVRFFHPTGYGPQSDKPE